MSDVQSTALTTITAALKLPGVKVNRTSFLLEIFKLNPKTKLPLTPEEQTRLIDFGPIDSGLAKK